MNTYTYTYAMARPGLVEDFFGAWIAEDEHKREQNSFDPDDCDWRLLFDFK
jgi:hypothetical protein